MEDPRGLDENLILIPAPFLTRVATFDIYVRMIRNPIICKVQKYLGGFRIIEVGTFILEVKSIEERNKVSEFVNSINIVMRTNEPIYPFHLLSGPALHHKGCTTKDSIKRTLYSGDKIIVHVDHAISIGKLNQKYIVYPYLDYDPVRGILYKSGDGGPGLIEGPIWIHLSDDDNISINQVHPSDKPILLHNRTYVLKSNHKGLLGKILLANQLEPPKIRRSYQCDIYITFS